jgi:hypothetical protein
MNRVQIKRVCAINSKIIVAQCTTTPIGHARSTTIPRPSQRMVTKLAQPRNRLPPGPEDCALTTAHIPFSRPEIFYFDRPTQPCRNLTFHPRQPAKTISPCYSRLLVPLTPPTAPYATNLGHLIPRPSSVHIATTHSTARASSRGSAKKISGARTRVRIVARYASRRRSTRPRRVCSWICRLSTRRCASRCC